MIPFRWPAPRRALFTALAATLFAAALAPATTPAVAQQDNTLVRDPGKQMSCRVPGRKATRVQIAGGQDAIVEEYKFIVQVRVGRGLCGGSLIAPGFALTAAHCVMPFPGARDCVDDGPGRCAIATPDMVTVIRPTPDGRAGGETAGAKAVFVHPKFRYPLGPNDPGALDADVAILVLDREFAVGRDEVVNIADPKFDRSFAEGGECARVAGWGRTDVLDSRLRVLDKGPATAKLQALNLELVARNRCESRYPGQITPNMICAGDGVEGFNTCKGDSGGPLVVDVGGPVQVGIVSWAYGCAQKEHYTIFARVGAPDVRGWINETILGKR